MRMIADPANWTGDHVACGQRPWHRRRVPPCRTQATERDRAALVGRPQDLEADSLARGEGFAAFGGGLDFQSREALGIGDVATVVEQALADGAEVSGR